MLDVQIIKRSNDSNDLFFGFQQDIQTCEQELPIRMQPKEIFRIEFVLENFLTLLSIMKVLHMV